MPISVDRLRSVVRIAQLGAIAVTALVLASAVALIVAEAGWSQPIYREPPEAFRLGSIGTDLMPLPVAHVLPDLFPEHFLPAGEGHGDWVEQFGFLRSDDRDNDGLPIGFVICRYRPQSAAPPPVAFVGFGCVLSYSSWAEPAGGSGQVDYGPGNGSLDLVAWLDAIQATLLQREPAAEGQPSPPHYRLPTEGIAAAYKQKKWRDLSGIERAMVSLGLRQMRDRLKAGMPRFDKLFGNGRSRQPDVAPAALAQRQPLRTLLPIHDKVGP